MKKLILTLFIVCLSLNICATTETWTTDHVISVTEEIDADDVLIIDTSFNQQPITISFFAGCGMEVYGSLLVYGSEDYPVYFTSATGSTYWSGIFIDLDESTCTDGVEMEYAVITKVYAPLNTNEAAIKVNNSDIDVKPIVLSHTTVHDNQGYYAGGLLVFNANKLVIDNCEFYENDPIFVGNFNGYDLYHGGGAISVFSSNEIQIDQCDIYNNCKSKHYEWDDDDRGGAGIYIQSSDEMSITDCAIYNNISLGQYYDAEQGILLNDGMGGGLFIDYCSHASITIDNNDIYGNECTAVVNLNDFEGIIGGGGIMLKEIATSTGTISNNLIHHNIANEGCGGGVNLCQITYCDLEISGNGIYNNECTIDFGGGIFLTDIEYNPITITDNEIFENCAVACGGVGTWFYNQEIRDCRFDFNNNNVYSNSAEYCGGINIECWNDENQFQNNIIHDNIQSSPENGAGGLTVSSDNHFSVNISGCVFYDNTCPETTSSTHCSSAIYCTSCTSTPGVTISNCTIIDHADLPILSVNSNININNTILWNPRTTGFYPGLEVKHNNVGQVTVIYSDVRNGTSGISPSIGIEYGASNIEVNPYLGETVYNDYTYYYPQWDSSGRSPCIDAGVPLFLDDDGTPIDIGANPAIAHTIDTWSLPRTVDPSGLPTQWRWMCFPALDRICQTPDYDMAEYMLEDILYTTILNHFEWMPSQQTGRQYIQYDNFQWTNENHIFTSQQGYKVQVVSTTPVELPVTGTLQNSATQVTLYRGYENWVGYFLDSTENAIEALAVIEDHVTSVQAQYWALQRSNGKWLGDTKSELEYGDMVVICVDQDVTLTWTSSSRGGTDRSFQHPYLFSYEEEADYVPFYVEYVPVAEYEEMAIYLDGECVGAKVCGDSLTQLCAFIFDENGEVEEGEVTFAVATGRGITKSLGNYMQYVNSDLTLVDSEIDLSDGRSYYHITFENDGSDSSPVFETSLSNHPNPFNPSTTIEFSLASDGKVSIEVFNVKGQKVKTLLDSTMPAGEHQIVWNAADSASGVYFIRLRTDGETRINKTLLLK